MSSKIELLAHNRKRLHCKLNQNEYGIVKILCLVDRENCDIVKIGEAYMQMNATYVHCKKNKKIKNK